MSIDTIHGTDFYNYRIRDANIIDIQHHTDNEEILSSKPPKDYQSHMRDRRKYGKCKKFRRFLYNTEKRTTCNRTGQHWGAMLFYYVFFLGMLLVLFLCYFYGIHRTMVPSNRMMPPIPKFYTSDVPSMFIELKRSEINQENSFTFVPIGVNPYPEPFLWYIFRGVDSIKNRKLEVYVKTIRDFYKAQATICAKMQSNKDCKVHPRIYGPCGEENFGYDEQKPCLFLKLNVKIGFVPDAYHSAHRVPKSMPAELKRIIDLNRETLCVHCIGESEHDRNHIGPIRYYPEACYNDSYFPSSELHLDINPTIAIQLNPDPGFVLELTCRLFGVNADGTGEHRQSVYIFIGHKQQH